MELESGSGSKVHALFIPSEKGTPCVTTGGLFTVSAQGTLDGSTESLLCPGQAAQLVRASTPCTEVAGSMSSQGTHKKQPMSASVSETANRCFSL